MVGMGVIGNVCLGSDSIPLLSEFLCPSTPEFWGNPGARSPLQDVRAGVSSSSQEASKLRHRAEEAVREVVGGGSVSIMT